MVRVKVGDPATMAFGLREVAVGTGLMMVTVSGVDVPPPGVGLETVTEAVPVAAMSAAVILACRLVLEMKVVGRLAEFHSMVEEETKLEPVTVKVKAGPPAMTVAGLREETEGAGFGGVLDPAGTAAAACGRGDAGQQGEDKRDRGDGPGKRTGKFDA